MKPYIKFTCYDDLLFRLEFYPNEEMNCNLNGWIGVEKRHVRNNKYEIRYYSFHAITTETRYKELFKKTFYK